jgi:hypothetical protein
VAKRSGDTAFAVASQHSKAAWHFASRRTQRTTSEGISEHLLTSAFAARVREWILSQNTRWTEFFVRNSVTK